MRLLLRPSTRAYRGLLASVFDLPWVVVCEKLDIILRGARPREFLGYLQPTHDHPFLFRYLAMQFTNSPADIGRRMRIHIFNGIFE